jgi:hypothetical protein
LEGEKIMSATTTEGTGPGAVERYIPRIYNSQIRLENILINQEEAWPVKIDGGELKAMVSALSDDDMLTIIKAAEIIKRLGIK